MPALSYSNSDFTPLTVISSSAVVTRFNDIKALLNTTKLDDDNIQNTGITRGTKLKTGTVDSVVINNSSGVMTDVAYASFYTTIGEPVGNKLYLFYNYT